ncbi:hypothetical protein TRFO_37613 [Tritrichomonas foetus]|uniref:Uncharacterized protein n=1 Tax=Tritrichomonas foetus TaxID=1144522 RepID=A0A1J4JFL2_9EUKA|nr:hypothetical protein TRFO_37613 [Tritrichomonas foetus]|eukprot:OHS96253.1 hypothetical protein TRFO_37613 [Tritrichomonas foetus]
MFSFHEFINDSDVFYSKSDDLKTLIELENYLYPFQKENIELTTKSILNMISKNSKSSYLIAKSIYKCCLNRPKHIESYLSLVHEIRSSKESFFKLFHRILIIEFKKYDQNNKARPEIIFIMNKLIEMNDFKPSDLIHTRMIDYLQFLHYFDSDQMKENLNEASNEFKHELIDLKKNKWELHLKLINDGMNHDTIANSIELDNINTFIQFVSNPKFQINGTIPFSIYERVLMPFNNLTYIEYAAFCGSLECFKHLLLSGAKKTERIAILAVCSGNAEIIHICEHNEIVFKDEVKYSLIYHHVEIFKWLIETKEEPFPKMIDFFNYCMIGGCYALIIEYLPKLTELKEFYKLMINDGNNLLFNFMKQFKETSITKDNNMIEASCENGNFELFKLFNSRFVNSKKKPISNLLLLHKAVYSESEDIVKALLERNDIDIDQKNEKGFAPIHIACQNSSHEVTRILLNHGCDINSQTENTGYTGLHYACENGNEKIVELILDQPHLMIDVRDQIEFETALHVACRRGFHEIVNHLIYRGFYINEVARCYMSPLHFACMNGNYEVVKILFTKNNKNYDTPDVNLKTSFLDFFNKIWMIIVLQM